MILWLTLKKNLLFWTRIKFPSFSTLLQLRSALFLQVNWFGRFWFRVRGKGRHPRRAESFGGRPHSRAMRTRTLGVVWGYNSVHIIATQIYDILIFNIMIHNYHDVLEMNNNSSLFTFFVNKKSFDGINRLSPDTSKRAYFCWVAWHNLSCGGGRYGSGHYGGGRYGGGRYGGAFQNRVDAAAESHDTQITKDATAERLNTCHC
jgi:hypothetical protein